MKIFLIFLFVYLLIGLGFVMFTLFDNKEIKNPTALGTFMVIATWPLIIIFSFICVKRGFNTLDDIKKYVEERKEEK